MVRLKVRRKVYAAVLLIQLVNGLRARETWKALQYFLEMRELAFTLDLVNRESPRPVKIPGVIRYREE